MVTKYSGYIHTPATRATGYVEDPDGRVVLATDYAALEAENAELKATDQYQRSLDEMHLRYNVEAELAAANATLDRLREVVPDNSGAWCEECCACVELGGEYATCMVCGEMPDDESSATWLMNKLQAILYPPETNHDHK